MRILKIKGPLLHQFTILIESIGIYLTELFRSWIVPCWLKDISSGLNLRVQPLNVIVLKIVPRMITTLRQICNVVSFLSVILFDINTKILLNSLCLVNVFEGDVIIGDT